MIFALATSLTLASIPAPAQALPEPKPVALAGLFGKKGRWVEQPQEVQYEGDYAPTVGRRPEPTNQPFGRVRYISPEERAQPIIVDPAPRLVYVDQQNEDENKSSSSTSKNQNADTSYETPSYITSTPRQEQQPQVEGLSPPGSATGSTAIPNYGSPN